MKRLRRKLSLLLSPELAGELARGGYRRIDLNGLLRFAYQDREEQARHRRQSWREGLMRLVSALRFREKTC